jgi:hypothetical protein
MIMHGAKTDLDRAAAQAAQAAQFRHCLGRDAVVTVSVNLGDRAPPPARGLEPNRGEIELASWTSPTDYAKWLPGIVRALSNGRNT